MDADGNFDVLVDDVWEASGNSSNPFTFFVEDELEPIVGKRVVDRLIGKPAFRTIRKKRPQLDTDLAQELLAVSNGGSKKSNPRRRDR